jgi:hypothetical protein
MKYLFNDNYGKNTSLYEYTQYYKFSTKSIDIIDSICVYIDDGNIMTYSLNKFIKLYDVLFNSKILVPAKTLDKYLFDNWKRFLENKGVEFKLEKEIYSINIIDNSVCGVDLLSGEQYGCADLVLAVPPIALLNIIRNDDMLKNSFGNYEDLEAWVKKTKYRNYISITYHFKTNIDFYDSNGLAISTEWGIIVMNLSEYCNKLENTSYPILSTMITLCDKKSSYINKCPNECNSEELILEVFRQLKICYINCENVSSAEYFAIINPNNYYDAYKKMWICSDNAYYNTLNEKYIEFSSKTIDNLYTLGTHNGKSYIPFNSIESAISNGISLGCQLYPDVRRNYFVKRGIYLKDLIFYFIIIMYTSIIYFSIYK